MKVFILAALIAHISSKLIIQSPARLRDLFPADPNDEKSGLGVIKASYANFGFIPYGHSMVSKQRHLISFSFVVRPYVLRSYS
jgi:hypothetical protein